MALKRQIKNQFALHDKIVAWAKEVREQAASMRPGLERDALLTKLRQAETAMHLEDWINSPALQPPK